jgi:hypothetical protein
MSHPSEPEEAERLHVVSDEEVADLADGRVEAGELARLARTLAGSAREAGARAVTSGRWLANTVIDVAPRIPIRDAQTLSEQHGGMSGAALAAELIRKASLASATIGGVSGAAMSATQFVPPAWITMPFELVVETVAIAVIELKLVGELHEVYGRPVPGDGNARTIALVQAWAERRGVTPATLATRGGLADALGRGTRNELVRRVRRRVLARMGRNLSSLAPLLAGAVAGAEVNRRATRSLGDAVVRDLASVRVSPS